MGGMVGFVRHGSKCQIFHFSYGATKNTNGESVTPLEQRLCTEPKDEQEEELRFAVASKEGISQQRSLKKVKAIPVRSINESARNMNEMQIGVCAKSSINMQCQN